MTTRPLRVLAVDDDPLNRTLVRAILARAGEPLRGTELDEARTIAEARGALARGSFDLVLLDIHLPDGLGLELATELGARPRPDRPAIVALTASVLPAEQQAAIDAGCDAFLAKPFQPEALIDVIRSFTTDARADGEPAAAELRPSPGPRPSVQ
ncbi:MAG: response regulator [Chloroflexi bacterium]|nr:response regulator [Chloroflexota bacterium]